MRRSATRASASRDREKSGWRLHEAWARRCQGKNDATALKSCDSSLRSVTTEAYMRLPFASVSLCSRTVSIARRHFRSQFRTTSSYSIPEFDDRIAITSNHHDVVLGIRTRLAEIGNGGPTPAIDRQRYRRSCTVLALSPHGPLQNSVGARNASLRGLRGP